MVATASLASPLTLRWSSQGWPYSSKKEDLSTFDQKEAAHQSSLHYAGFEAGAEAGEPERNIEKWTNKSKGQPVAGLCAKTAGERFTGCCRDVVEVEVVG